ncbi:hypothetical protein EYR40_010241 [Pleurotus pulmonarius]|nr:hypothetical protein EYR36_010367 [Pleurotus pulmonarius]KAF4588688.1 hypothetical protein EYR40_010241 [Pleurotus pulmonarius]
MNMTTGRSSDPPSPSAPQAPEIPNGGSEISGLPTEITPETDLASLSQSQLYELNQNLLEDSVPTRALIEDIAPMSVLRAEYENGSQSFVKQIDSLVAKGFNSIRRARGDGDCFYRSVAFAYVDSILKAADVAIAAASAISLLESTFPMLEQAGFQKLVFEDFYDVLASLLQNIAQGTNDGKSLESKILLAFQSPEISNSIVVYLRLLTSARIRTDPDEYAPFLFHPEIGIQLEPREFCEAFVEAVGKEADHVQMTALARTLRLNLDVAYLDGRSSDGHVDFVEFRNSDSTPLTLLYRPGHYDILLKSGNGHT